MIFTSYFGKRIEYRDDVIPVAICAKPPKGWNGACYKKLAPPYDLLMQWKKDPRNDDYFGLKRRQYMYAVLNQLDVHQVLRDLQFFLPGAEPVWLSKKYHIVLLCYEKPCDFCHRHLVAEWLRKNGIECGELGNVRHEPVEEED